MWYCMNNFGWVFFVAHSQKQRCGQYSKANKETQRDNMQWPKIYLFINNYGDSAQTRSSHDHHSGDNIFAAQYVFLTKTKTRLCRNNADEHCWWQPTRWLIKRVNAFGVFVMAFESALMQSEQFKAKATLTNVQASAQRPLYTWKMLPKWWENHIRRQYALYRTIGRLFGAASTPNLMIGIEEEDAVCVSN